MKTSSRNVRIAASLALASAIAYLGLYWGLALGATDFGADFFWRKLTGLESIFVTSTTGEIGSFGRFSPQAWLLNLVTLGLALTSLIRAKVSFLFVASGVQLLLGSLAVFLEMWYLYFSSAQLPSNFVGTALELNDYLTPFGLLHIIPPVFSCGAVILALIAVTKDQKTRLTPTDESDSFTEPHPCLIPKPVAYDTQTGRPILGYDTQTGKPIYADEKPQS